MSCKSSKEREIVVMKADEAGTRLSAETFLNRTVVEGEGQRMFVRSLVPVSALHSEYSPSSHRTGIINIYKVSEYMNKQTKVTRILQMHIKKCNSRFRQTSR